MSRTPLQAVDSFARDLANLGHVGSLTVRLPPRIFREACDEVDALSRFSGRLPPETSMLMLGEPRTPAAIKWASPAGYVTVIPESAD